MTKKQTKVSTDRLKKTLAISGLLLVILGCIASIYSAYVNQRFIHEFLDYVYYLRYLILIGGGFIVGCLLTKRQSGKSDDRLFNGAVYSALAVNLFELFDMLRVVTQGIFGFPLFPLGKLSFAGLPLLAIITTAIIAYIVRRKTDGFILNTFVKVTLLFSFIFYQAYLLANSIYYQAIGVQLYDHNVPLWLVVSSYLASTLVIGAISYLLLAAIKTPLDRLFYAGIIATFYSTFSYVLWEFRTDPSVDATNIFRIAVTLAAVLFVASILWQARKATR